MIQLQERNSQFSSQIDLQLFCILSLFCAQIEFAILFRVYLAGILVDPYVACCEIIC